MRDGPAASHVLALASIRFDGANGALTHAPLAVGDVGGVRTRLILDTGSDVHLLTVELARQIGLELVPGEAGTDHSGATMASWSAGDVALRLGGAELTLRGTVAIPAPGPFAALGIGGILSPQHLHPTAAVVLDLRDGELLLIEGDDATLEGFMRARSSGYSLVRLARDLDHATVVVAAAIDPFSAVPTLVDTGGRQTEFAVAAVPGLTAQTEERLGAGVFDTAVVGGRVGAQILTVGGQRIPVPSLAIRQAMDGPRGLIAMDVLHGHVLACAADVARPLFWLMPRGAD